MKEEYICSNCCLIYKAQTMRDLWVMKMAEMCMDCIDNDKHEGEVNEFRSQERTQL